MKTAVINDPHEAARILRGGGIVAFPTETVYGLGADVFNEAALAKIFVAKGRPQDNPLIAHISSLDQIALLATEVPESAQRFIDRFFPGPLTLVLAKAPAVPLTATAGLETIGVRMPRHPLAQQFLRACGTPVAAPSANLSGRPSPTTYQAVVQDLLGRVDAILIGDQTEVGLESTVVDCTGEAPVILRAGAVTFELLRRVVPATRSAREGDETDRSPGTHHRHYSPQARVVLVESMAQAKSSADAAFIGFPSVEPATPFEMQHICTTYREYAHELFLFFRICDAEGIKTIYCQTVREEGIGRAIMDRLRRAEERDWPRGNADEADR
jgi:L-threonylcarbamoyladenylate synthase